eukprot:6023087-Lingulodinium_polyedra.AAC.1
MADQRWSGVAPAARLHECQRCGPPPPAVCRGRNECGFSSTEAGSGTPSLLQGLRRDMPSGCMEDPQ